MKKLLLTILLICCSVTYATSYESAERIKAAVKDFVETRLKVGPDEHIKIKVGRVDKHLKLAKCDNDIEVFIPPGYENTNLRTVGVRCDAEQTWTLYVPVDISIFSQVVTAARILPRQTTITESDLRLVEMDRARLFNGYYCRKNEIIGKITRQHVGMGVPITPKQLQAPLAVKRGQRVIILAQEGNMKVEMKGEAITEGGVGELVKVRNMSSMRIVQAVILDSSVVKVQL